MHESEFDQFWAAFPRKVGKLAALAAFKRARTQATLAEILDGITRYVQGKPQYADFCHPRTWLSQGRWMDEYETRTPAPAQPADWQDECQRLHGGACDHDPIAHHRRKLREAVSA